MYMCSIGTKHIMYAFRLCAIEFKNNYNTYQPHTHIHTKCETNYIMIKKYSIKFPHHKL